MIYGFTIVLEGVEAQAVENALVRAEAALAAATESGDADVIAANEKAVGGAQASTEEGCGEAEVAITEADVTVSGCELEKAEATTVLEEMETHAAENTLEKAEATLATGHSSYMNEAATSHQSLEWSTCRGSKVEAISFKRRRKLLRNEASGACFSCTFLMM